jgi:hypothetical protein
MNAEPIAAGDLHQIGYLVEYTGNFLVNHFLYSMLKKGL